MFRIYHKTDNHKEYVVLEKGTTKATICLHEGARLVALSLKGKKIIDELPNFAYQDSYASSILFPFASRIKNGAYTFLGEKHQLVKNDNGKNALHGLVYDQKFTLFEPEEHENYGVATFNFYQREKSNGFPYRYFISVTYTLYEDKLQLKVTLKNEDTIHFPFVLGWHPYFYSSSLFNSTLSFKSDKKVLFDENLITKEIVDETQEGAFSLANKSLDDCFFLNDSAVQFTTPDYAVEISSTEIQNFLQLYTPKNQPAIAIEPMTGISDSFNNRIGLQILAPQKTHTVAWNVVLTN